MPRTSAGVLMYRFAGGELQVLLVHPGGPLWARKDLGAWSIPKGEMDENEDSLEAARREFHEETGVSVGGKLLPLGSVKQRGGKVVYAWAAAGDCDPARLRSSTFSIEWPPRSGRTAQFPEIDRAAWFPIAEARRRIVPGQAAFLDRLVAAIGGIGATGFDKPPQSERLGGGPRRPRAIRTFAVPFRRLRSLPERKDKEGVS